MKNSEDVVIKVDNVKKYFKVYPDKGKTLKDKVLFHERNKYEKHEVLKGISFEVKRGEAIGLIGKNGCGKSTTLKLLTRILRPNEGTITIDGRVSSLIELGAGFHPDLTGRENIYINASIFGIKSKEVDERLDDIIRFSELEEFIDNPVRTYSSGMYMRLAFSVAINVDADVLLIDEILAVGDMNFQEKCFRKLQEIKRNGTTIVIVSHAQGQIEKICDRCIWIEDGLIRLEGKTKQVTKEYQLAMESMRSERAQKEAEEELEKLKSEKDDSNVDEKKKREREQKEINASCWNIAEQCCADAHRKMNGGGKITSVVMKNLKGEKTTKFLTEDDICIQIKYKTDSGLNSANFAIGITRDDWTYCCSADVKHLSNQTASVGKEGVASVIINKNKLLPGKYYLDVILIDDEKNIECDYLYSIIQFEIYANRELGFGIFKLDYVWNIDNKSYKYND